MSMRSKILTLLEEHKGSFLSGEEIAGMLGCSRTAVWKAVRDLREKGYIIEAVQNRGYHLLAENDRLSAEAILMHLAHPEAGVCFLQETDSTNRVAKEKALSGEASHGFAVVAAVQKAGRGRRGKSFFSPEGGLYMSIVLKTGGSISQSLTLTTAAAVAVYRAVLEVYGIALQIKWVNDLYYNGKKVCGILTEAVADIETGQIDYAVVGIGLNVCVDPASVPEELKEIMGGLFYTSESRDGMHRSLADRNRLAAEIINVLLEEIRKPAVPALYIENNMIPGNEIHILDGERSRDAFALGIEADGRLRVRERDGSESLLSFGEVSVRQKDI